MTLCQLLECASITERKQKFVQFLLILGKQVSHTFFMNADAIILRDNQTSVSSHYYLNQSVIIKLTINRPKVITQET